MKISDMILKLNEIREKYGDLKIGGGNMSDDVPPKEIIVLNEHGCDIKDEGGFASEVFIQ